MKKMTKIDIRHENHNAERWTIAVTSLLFCLWVMGVALAQGACAVVVAIFFPPYSLYLVAERLLEVAGWLPSVTL